MKIDPRDILYAVVSAEVEVIPLDAVSLPRGLRHVAKERISVVLSFTFAKHHDPGRALITPR